MGCSTCAQVRHAAHVVRPVDFQGGKHVYRVHPIHHRDQQKTQIRVTTIIF